MARKVTNVHRQQPYEETLSVSLNDRLDLRFSLEDQDGNALTTEVLSAFTMVAVPDKEDLAAGPKVLDLTQASNMSYAAPDLDVTILASDWSPSMVKGKFKCKVQGNVDGRAGTPSLFYIEVTD